MSGRKNYYFRQKVTEAELDAGFNLLEVADRNWDTDISFVGVAKNAVVTEKGAGANLTVDISGTGAVYDKLGERISWVGTQNVDVSVDESAASTAVTTPGNLKIVSVFAKFKRLLTDPRTDGNSMTVFFDEAESFEFIVRQGAEAVSPTPPPLDATFILLADITRSFGQTQILNANINTFGTNRREDMFVSTGTPRSLRRGVVRDALADLLSFYNNHVNGAADKHAATAVDAAIAALWADATGIAGTTVDAALEEVVSDLAALTGDVKVGSPARAASFLFGLSSGSVGSQLAAIQALLDIGTRGRKVTTVLFGASPYTLLSTDRQINANTTGGAISLNLPAPAHGIEYHVKDPVGTWGTNNLTLVRFGSEKIENVAANRVFAADFGSFRVYTDGTDWFLD